MVIQKYLKYLGIFATATFLFSGCAYTSRNSQNGKIVMSQESQINSIIKQNTERSLNEWENQSVIKRKDIQYFREDPIKIREPQKYIVWSRADVINIDNDFLYVVPEGYRTMQEIAGELYIDYEPSKEEETLRLEE